MSDRFIKGQHGRQHVDDIGFESGVDGTQERALSEPVPAFFARPGDGVITARGMELTGTQDNNTMIVFGRDRSGLGEIDTEIKEFKNSLGVNNYGDHMAAGAIDIVVGRMAPYPLALKGTSFGPLFTTKGLGQEGRIKKLQAELLSGVKQNGDLFFTNHPGYAMDAARIYISQMSDVDHNFEIERTLTRSTGVRRDNNVRTPCSSIMTKADKLRMHARQDIKIVTGGEEINSQGNDITETGGIHLIAGNRPGLQQPIPKGDTLVDLLKVMNTRIKELSTILFSFAQFQIEYNKVLGPHVHQSPFYGIATSPSITTGPKCIETITKQFTIVQQDIVSFRSKLVNLEEIYLREKGRNYINSEFNTTN